MAKPKVSVEETRVIVLESANKLDASIVAFYHRAKILDYLA